MRLTTMILVLTTMATAGCTNGETQLLRDPDTDEVIGYYDVEAAEYVFDHGLRVANVPPLVSEDPQSDVGRTEAALGGTYVLDPTCEEDHSGGACGDPDGSSCWYRRECSTNGCYMCRGCCVNYGNGIWSCWQECTSEESSGGSSGRTSRLSR